MLIFDSLARVEGGMIKIPFYHRGHMSLKSQTQVTVCVLPPIATSALPSMTEMIITPIPFTSWDRLLRISGTFYEQPGIVSKLLGIINNLNFNVLMSESSTAENKLLHKVEIIVADDNRHKFYNDLIEDEYIESVQRKIISFFSKEELPIRADRFRLRVRRMKGLKAAYNKANEFDLPPYSIIEKIGKNGIIKVPKKIYELLGTQDNIRAQLISDTKKEC